MCFVITATSWTPLSLRNKDKNLGKGPKNRGAKINTLDLLLLGHVFFYGSAGGTDNVTRFSVTSKVNSAKSAFKRVHGVGGKGEGGGAVV